MKLFEIFSPSYVVKKLSHTEYEVSKFGDRKEPESAYRVEKRGGKFWTDSPGYVHRGQDEKHIKIVKQFIADGEPGLVTYAIDASGKITGNKLGENMKLSDLTEALTWDALLYRKAVSFKDKSLKKKQFLSDQEAFNFLKDNGYVKVHSAAGGVYYKKTAAKSEDKSSHLELLKRR